MSGKRDRLGLLLPIPALLAVEPGAAQAEDGTAALEGLGMAAEALEGPDIGPCLSPPMPEPEPEPPVGPCLTPMPEDPPPEDRPHADPPADWAEAPPAPDEVKARELFDLGRQAMIDDDMLAAARAFEQAAQLAPDKVELLVDAAMAYRYATTDERDPNAAAELCEATRRNAEAVIGHPRATEELRERALKDTQLADEHCAELMDTTYGPCLSPVEPCLSPCLSPIPRARGCAGRRGEPLAMLGGLMLLGLRSRRRRDAVERMADRLPPDVAAKLRQNDDDPGDPG